MKTLGIIAFALLLASMALLNGQTGGPSRIEPLPPASIANGLPPLPLAGPWTPGVPQNAINREPAPTLPKVNASILERAFHLKLTKQKIDKTELVLIFEFTKSIDDVDKVRTAFHAPADPEIDKGKSEKPKIYLFDEDNVVIEIKPVGKTSGIITGRAGDAFRLHLSSVIENAGIVVRKIEFRSDAELPVAQTMEPTAKQIADVAPLLRIPATPSPWLP